MRLLALLVVLAALLALGMWTLMHERPGAVESALASAPEPEAARDALLAVEPEVLPQRQEAELPSVPRASSNRIRGRVVRGRQAIPVAGVEVRCTKVLPPTRIEGPVRLDKFSGRILSRDGPLPESPALRCTSGPDGQFEFPNLDGGAHYALEARGLGWVLVERPVGIAPSEEVCTLVVQRIYVARVLATDEDGKPPMTSCQYLRYARVAGPGECESLPFNDPDGQSSEEPGEQYVFTSDCEAGQLGPFRILICCPGYQREDFEFWAYPKGQSALPTIFRLKRSTDKAGTLRVRQECDCAEAGCWHLLEGEVDLESAEEVPKTLSFDIQGEVREQVFSEIPAGRWRARVRAKYGGFCYPAADLPALEITVGDEPAVLQVPVANLGAIRFGQGAEGIALRRIPIAWESSGGTAGSASIWSTLEMRGVESGTRMFEADGEPMHVEVIAGKLETVTLGKN